MNETLQKSIKENLGELAFQVLSLHAENAELQLTIQTMASELETLKSTTKDKPIVDETPEEDK